MDWERNKHRSISRHSLTKVIQPTEGFPRLLRHNSMAEGSFGCDYIMAVDCVWRKGKRINYSLSFKHFEKCRSKLVPTEDRALAGV